MHLTEGEIRAFIDHELETERTRLVEAHLAACSECQALAGVLCSQAQRVSAKLALLEPELDSSKTILSTTAGRAHLEERLATIRKEQPSMWNNIFSKRMRPAWVLLAIVVLLAVSLAFPPVQAIANSFLGLFRVQQIAVIPVNPEQMPKGTGNADRFEAFLTENVTVEKRGDRKDVTSAAEASALANMTVRLPAFLQDQPRFEVQPGARMTMKVDLNRIQAVLSEMGNSDIRLPANLDGAEVTVEIPDMVAAMYGDCNFDPPAPQDDEEPQPIRDGKPANCITLLQFYSPSVSAPEGLDLAAIGEVYLQLLGMSREDAASFANSVDWTTTLVIPVPRFGAEYQEITVDGVEGTVVLQGDRYLLLWVRDGVIYGLSGPGDLDMGLQIGNSMQ